MECRQISERVNQQSETLCKKKKKKLFARLDVNQRDFDFLCSSSSLHKNDSWQLQKPDEAHRLTDVTF